MSAPASIVTDAELVHRVTIDEKIATDDMIRRRATKAAGNQLNHQLLERFKALVELRQTVELAKAVHSIEGLPRSILREAHGLLRDQLKAARK